MLYYELLNNTDMNFVLQKLQTAERRIREDAEVLDIFHTLAALQAARFTTAILRRHPNCQIADILGWVREAHADLEQNKLRHMHHFIYWLNAMEGGGNPSRNY